MKLYLNDILFKIKDGNVRQTFQINNLAELKNRQSTFSNRIIILPTDDNIRNLDLLGIIGNVSRKPYENIKAKLISEDIELIADGTAVISGNTKRGYTVVLYDGIIELNKSLSNKKLSDLDLSIYDHDLTTTNFTDSFSNTSGYIYGIADFGRFNESKIIINNQVPSIFVHRGWI